MVSNRAERHVVAGLQVPYGEQDRVLGGTERQGRRDLVSKQAQQRHGSIHVRDERSHLGIVHRNVAGAEARPGAPARAATDIRCVHQPGIRRNSCSWMPPWPLPRLLQASLLRQSTKDRTIASPDPAANPAVTVRLSPHPPPAFGASLAAISSSTCCLRSFHGVFA